MRLLIALALAAILGLSTSCTDAQRTRVNHDVDVAIAFLDWANQQPAGSPLGDLVAAYKVSNPKLAREVDAVLALYPEIKGMFPLGAKVAPH